MAQGAQSYFKNFFKSGNVFAIYTFFKQTNGRFVPCLKAIADIYYHFLCSHFPNEPLFIPF